MVVCFDNIHSPKQFQLDLALDIYIVQKVGNDRL